MRILLATYGSRGDVQPLVALARGLIARGHAPLLCAPPDFEDYAAEHRIPFRALGSSMRALLARSELNPRAAVAKLKKEVAQHFATLAEVAPGIDLVLGSASEVAAPSIAEWQDVPYRYVAFSPQALPSRAHPPPYVPWPSLPGWLSRGTWATVGAAFNLLGRSTLNAHRARLQLPPLRDVLPHVLPRQAIVAADPALAELPEDLIGEAFHAGSLILADDARPPLPPEVEAFLADGPPPVYLGFGSLTDRDPARTTALLLRAVRDAGCRAIFSAGWAGLGEGAALPTGDDVLRISELSHARLFPRLAAVVHHGGAGTTATAARAGVPQVIVPHFLDQPYWGLQVHRRGLGPAPIPRRALDAARLTAALREATSAVMRERARAFATRLPDDGVERTVTFLEGLRQATPGRAKQATRNAPVAP